MGQVKSAWMESEDRGWDAPEKFVCVDCVEDGFLKACIQNNVEALTCSYCGHQSSECIAAPVEAIMHYIGDALFIYFAEPDAAGLPRDSYDQIGLTDTDDALSSLPLLCDENLLVDIVDAFHYPEWIPCAEGHWMSKHASTRWMWDWEHFKKTVKTKTRYFFISADLKKDDFEEECSPSDLLNRIGLIAEDLGLYRKLEAGISLYRAREVKSTEKFDTFEKLGPPPSDKASAGRMNPAGIAYLYLAREKRTAIGEILKRPPCQVTIATFSPSSDLTTLDLTAIPEAPSAFDVDNNDSREAVLFLEEFVKAISQPIAKNGREHIDYVPSQVVSEFFAQIFVSGKFGRINGIIYPSTVVPDGKNIVIFPPREWRESWKTLVQMTDFKSLSVNNWEELSALISA